MSRTLKLLLFAAGGLVLAGVGLGYLHWAGLQEDLVRMNAAMDQAREHQERLLHQFEATTEELESHEARLREQEERLSRKRAELAAQQEQLEVRRHELAEKATEAVSWRIAEAERLIALADLRLRLEQDAQSALEALRAATGLLTDTGDARWEGVRQSLPERIHALEAAHPPDRAALTQRLGRLRVQAGTLPPLVWAPAWRGRLPAAADRAFAPRPLEGGTTRGSPIAPGRERGTRRLNRQDIAQIRHILDAQIEIAAHALQRGDEELFRLAMEGVETWIHRFFDVSHPGIAAFLAEVQDLRSITVRIDFPSLEPVLHLMRAAGHQGQKQEKP